MCKIGIDKTTCPPPIGGSPRLSIFKPRPSEHTPNRFNMLKVVELNVSTDGSLESFVIPDDDVNITYVTSIFFLFKTTNKDSSVQFNLQDGMVWYGTVQAKAQMSKLFPSSMAITTITIQ